MNSASEDPGLNTGPNAINNKTPYATLAAAAGLGFVFVLIVYVALSGRSPVPRVGYGIFVSLLPALGAIAVLKITHAFASRKGAVIVYFALFVLVLILQAFGRLIPVTG